MEEDRKAVCDVTGSCWVLSAPESQNCCCRSYKALMIQPVSLTGPHSTIFVSHSLP